MENFSASSEERKGEREKCGEYSAEKQTKLIKNKFTKHVDDNNVQ